MGGDKSLLYFPTDEHNSSLGWRGIRISLDHPELFLIQLRAMLRANAGLDNLQILFPMISSVDEVDEALGLLERAYQELQEEAQAAARPRVGAMIEVPPQFTWQRFWRAAWISSLLERTILPSTCSPWTGTMLGLQTCTKACTLP